MKCPTAYAVCLIATLLTFPVAAQTVVSVTPTSLNFTYSPGNALPAAQAVALKAGTGTPAYSVAISGVNALWLTATPDTGKLAVNLSVRVNPTSLAAGTYTASVVVTVTGAAAPINIPVTLVVNTPLPVVTLSANTLAFTAPPSPPVPQTVKLSTSGSPASYTATITGSPWLTVSPATGILVPGSQTTLSISVDTTTLLPQTAPYTGKITIAAPAATAATKQQTITVTVSVAAQTATISSLWPASVPLNSPATTVTIRGTNFYAASVAKVTGVTAPLVTTVLGSNALLAVVPASLLNTAGQLSIVVANPAPGGNSAPATLTVGANPTIQATVNAANMLTGPIAPGELITLFGDSLGPSTPAMLADSDADGLVDSSLGGVTATVDGFAAPLIYVSQNQITLQVPYEVSTGSGKIISVTDGVNAPATATVTINSTAPGIFTLDGSGAGAAAALNYNATTMQYSVNTASNAAKLGDTVVLYVTGEGDYAPTLTPRTGLLTPLNMSPIPQLSPLPVVTIGGTPATVSYAGPALGSVLGLLQLNVVVPTGIPTGSGVAVVVTVGGNASQPNATIALKP